MVDIIFFWKFGPITNHMCCTFLHKCIFLPQCHPKNDQIWLYLQNERGGVWCMQGESGTQYKWRTRFEWRTHSVDSVGDPTNPPPLRIRSPRGPPEGRPSFQSSLVLGYLNLVQWSDLLIHGRPTTAYWGRWSIENWIRGALSITLGQGTSPELMTMVSMIFDVFSLFMWFKTTPLTCNFANHPNSHSNRFALKICSSWVQEDSTLSKSITTWC